MPASEEEKIPAVEMDKNSTRDGGGIGVNIEGKDQAPVDSPDDHRGAQQQQETGLPGVTEEPRKDVLHVPEEGTDLPSDAVQTHVLHVPEEEDASENPQLKKKKKEKERKTRKLVKSQVLVEPHMPGDTQDAHLLAVLEEEDGLKNPQMKKKEKKRKRSELQEIKKEQLSDAEKKEKKSKRSEPWRWHATFSTVLNRKELHKGFILLRGNVKRIVLINIDGTRIEAKYLQKGETVYPGAVVEFPCHMVDVGETIFEDEAIFAPIEQGKKRDLKRKRLKRKPQS